MTRAARAKHPQGSAQLENGKIKVWRDYFDLGTYAKGMS
jgi:limonene-1,2-epoxide hydrolase